MNKAPTVDELLNLVDYAKDDEHVPTEFSVEFIDFIKLVNGEVGEENSSPVVHYKIMDGIANQTEQIVNMIFRGAAKTSLMEYLILYIAVYGNIPKFGTVDLAIYVSDSIENGVKNMRKNLEYRYENSMFLQYYITKAKFTDVRWEFHNREGHVFIVKGYGVLTGVRGTKEKATRPQLALLDDLLTDEGARSKTVMQTVEDTVYKAINYALNPNKKKAIWNGTPFNKHDPMYKAAESGAWRTSVFPVCNKFPCTKEEFEPAWGERFTYKYVMDQYQTALLTGTLSAFDQELMLRVMSDENRLVQDEDIVWYQSSVVRANPSAFNFYITTDFATSETAGSDPSVGLLWAYSNQGHWLLVDGFVKRQLMDKNIDWVFEMVGEFQETLQEVGIEVSGQQGGFIPWLYREMTQRNCYFNLATSNNSNKAGIRPVTKKLTRFKVAVPLFKTKKIWLPEDMKDTTLIQEILEQLRYATVEGLKAKEDDLIDGISMLTELSPWKPSQMSVVRDDESGVWELDLETDVDSGLSNYIG